MTSRSTISSSLRSYPGSRRAWLKGLGALLGTGLLVAPSAVLAQLAVPPGTPGAALAGGEEGIGLVKLFAGPAVPAGWLPCDGRSLPVAEHPALFAALGATYGGDGRRTFALPLLVPAAGATLPGQELLPNWVAAVKVASGAATTTALATLRLQHQRRRARPTS